MQQVYQLLFYTMKVSATVLLPRSLHYTDKEHRLKVINSLEKWNYLTTVLVY